VTSAERRDIRRPARLVTGLVCLTVSGVGIAASLGLDTGSLADPGPGLWPLIVSCLSAVGALGLVLPSRTPEDSEPFTRSSRQVAAAVAGMVGYALLFPHTGFTLPAFLLLLAWIRVLGGERWAVAVTVAAAASAGFFCLFALMLDVPLPRDLIWGV
jgi:putative tricarboxylic transport membrane protein